MVDFCLVMFIVFGELVGKGRLCIGCVGVYVRMFMLVKMVNYEGLIVYSGQQVMVGCVLFEGLVLVEFDIVLSIF